jgi:hypothetical protein
VRKLVAFTLMVLMVAVPAVSLARPSAPLPLPMPASPEAAVPPEVAPLLHGMPAAWQDLLRVNEAHLLGAALPQAPVAPPTMPSEGIRGVLALAGAPADAVPPGTLAAYDALPADLRDALSSMLNAYLLAAQLAHGAVPSLTRDDLARLHSAADGTTPLPAPVDYARLLAAQRVMLAAAQAMLPVLQRDLPLQVSVPATVVCPALAIDLNSGANQYTCDVVFAVDGGGDDWWMNNAGGTGAAVPLSGNFGATLPAFALDYTGNDHYLGTEQQGAATGGGFGNAGVLIDVGGNDVYDTVVQHAGALNGGSEVGAGFLFDTGGDDSYDGAVGVTPEFHNEGGGVNGGSVSGSGLIVDAQGNDRYDGYIGGSGGVNGGAHGGAGSQFDFAGDDSYDGFNNNLGGVNGGAFSGWASLVDVSGSDTYRGTQLTLGAVNGGAFVGVGLLVDCGAQGVDDDTFDAFNGLDGGVNGGAFIGSGFLLNCRGNDRYDGFNGGDGGVNGGGFLPEGLGQLWDFGGDDFFTGDLRGSGGVNGGSFFGIGDLGNRGGNDVYESRSGPSATRGVNGATFFGSGMLFDSGGLDLYRDVDTLPYQQDQTIVLKGTAGFQMDCPDGPGGIADPLHPDVCHLN